MFSQRSFAGFVFLIGVGVGTLVGTSQNHDDGFTSRHHGSISTSRRPTTASRPADSVPYEPSSDARLLATPASSSGIHSEPATTSRNPKPPTSATLSTHRQVIGTMDMSDRQDFEDAQRGFVAPLPNDGVVRDDEGKVVWNLKEYVAAPLDQPCPDTVNPSLWRQSQLMGISGLFQVSKRIYQVRGLDLANITFIEGNTGLIVIDPLLSTETAAAAAGTVLRTPTECSRCQHHHHS